MAGRKKTDSAANSSMAKLIKQGNANEGFYYKNEGEDVGSVSAVLPNGNYVRVKLADAVTYDNDGSVIPLSQRFNRKTPTSATAALRSQANPRSTFLSRPRWMTLSMRCRTSRLIFVA